MSLLFLFRTFVLENVFVKFNFCELRKFLLLHIYLMFNCFHGFPFLPDLLRKQLIEGAVPFNLQLLQFSSEILDGFLEVMGDELYLL